MWTFRPRWRKGRRSPSPYTITVSRTAVQLGGFYFESQYIYNLGIGIRVRSTQLGEVVSLLSSFVERACLFLRVKRRHLPLPWPGEFLG